MNKTVDDKNMSLAATPSDSCLQNPCQVSPVSSRHLLDLTGQVLFEEDLPNGRVHWHGALKALTGDPLEAFEGLGLEVLHARVHPDDRHLVEQAMLDGLRSCEEYTSEFRILHRDGGLRQIQLRARYDAEADGRPFRHLGVLCDLTSLRQAEAHRLEMERQVLHCQKLETLGILAGGIAHDFNNLLTSVLGNLNLAQLKISPESPAVPHMENMERAILRASDLTRQMLAYSGRGHVVVQPHNLNRIIQEIHHLLQVSISKRIVVRMNLTDRLPSIEADATQIQQIVLNLVTNASDAIGDQDGTIRITTTNALLDEDYIRTTLPGWPIKPGRHVVMEVSDTGCGMKPDVLVRIFDPFFTTKNTGRGLGLSTMLSILRSHQGGLKVYSEPGLGSTFKLFFPALKDMVSTTAWPGETAGRVGKGAILIVDDEQTILDTTGQAIEGMGFEVLRAADGLEALSMVEQHGARLEMILMDLTMPRMDGREAFRAIHAKRPEIPIMLTSGFNEEESIAEFRGKGLAGFIQKPYLLKDLRKAIFKTVQQNWQSS